MTSQKLQTNFKRIETKYILDKGTLADLKRDLQDYLIDDDYARSTISNIYFDNDDYQMVQDSLARRNGREKVRMRTYDSQPSEDSQVFLEIKKKDEEVGYKFRLVSKPPLVLNYIEKGVQDTIVDDDRVVKELNHLRDRYCDLKPKMYISYHRHSMKAKRGHKVRLTVDTNLLYRDEDLDLTLGRYGYPLLADDKVIMEIKVSGAYPTWLVHVLKKYGLEDQSFSKYGNAYLKRQERLSKLIKS